MKIVLKMHIPNTHRVMIVKNVLRVSLIMSNPTIREFICKKTKKTCTKQVGLERAMRIELTTKAWEAFVLPLNYARIVTL